MPVKWGRSSVGRAPALQAGGQEFESLRLHSSVFYERRNPGVLLTGISERRKTHLNRLKNEQSKIASAESGQNA